MKSSKAVTLHPVQRSRCEETVECLEALLCKARAGRVIGLACITTDGGAQFDGYATGACRERPISTRGALRTLDDGLREIVGGKMGLRLGR